MTDSSCHTQGEKLKQCNRLNDAKTAKTLAKPCELLHARRMPKSNKKMKEVIRPSLGGDSSNIQLTPIVMSSIVTSIFKAL